MIKSVAVVDDSSEFQQLAKVMFSYLGIDNVKQWNSSAEALSGLLQSPPDIVLLDVMMAGMTGLDVWMQLRTHPNTMALPVIVCTAAVNRIVEHEQRLERDEHTLLLPKPFTLDDLRHSLDTLAPHWKH